jgi:hypothetical protein
MHAVMAAHTVASFLPMEWIGPGALLGVVFLMVMRGLLVPRAWLNEVKQDRDYWRQLSQQLTAQNGELLRGARVVEDVLQAIPTQADGVRGSRD